MGYPALRFSEFKEGGCVGRPAEFQYFITQGHSGVYMCHWSSEDFLTLEEAQAAAQKDYRARFAQKEASGE